MTARELMLARMAATAGLLRELTSDVEGDVANQPPAPGEWPIIEVVRHLLHGVRDTFLPRLRRMLAEARPVFEKTTVAAADRSDLPTLVGAFASAREQVMKTLHALEEAGWRRDGVSPSRGALSVEAYAASMDAHDTEHLGQIHDVRTALGLRPKRCEARVALAVPDIVQAIETASARFAEAAEGLRDAQRRHRPAPGAWCVNEVMAHLHHVETVVFLPRLQRILAEDHPAFTPFSPEPWTHERDHSLDSFTGSLAAFAKARSETVALLGSLPAGGTERLGLSSFFGPVTLAQFATHIADHDIEHLAQMGECRRAAEA